MPIKKHTFQGRRVHVSIEEKVEGYAQFGKAKGRDEIYIDPELPPRKFLDRACHEAIHFLYPTMVEQSVEAGGRELARWLWRLGYRRNA